MTIKLEYGKRYVTRNGAVTSPLCHCGGEHASFKFESVGCEIPDARWRHDGTWSLAPDITSDNDLVSEYVKPSNPKDSIGVTKPPLSCVPCGPLFEIGAAMLDGSCKYGRHNYREIGVRARRSRS
jgi:hypothetical protein